MQPNGKTIDHGFTQGRKALHTPNSKPVPECFAWVKSQKAKLKTINKKYSPEFTPTDSHKNTN